MYIMYYYCLTGGGGLLGGDGGGKTCSTFASFKTFFKITEEKSKLEKIKENLSSKV